MRPWRSGEQVGDYLLLDRVGAGAMGEVWHARYVPTGAERALKRVLDADEDALERFDRESEALGRINHPNVLAVHGRFAHGAEEVLVTELALGGDLAARLRSGPAAIEDAKAWAICLANALGVVHDAGVLHRDLKPGNVLFSEDGRPLLGDFGLAKLADRERLTQTGTIVGTPAYMAPELALGQAGDARSEVYGLAAVLYHCLTGQPPHSGATPLAVLDSVLNTAPPPIRSLRPDVPAALARACEAGLAKSPGDRPESARAWARSLERGAEGRSRSVGLVLSLLLLAVVAGLFAFKPWGAREAAAKPSPGVTSTPLGALSLSGAEGDSSPRPAPSLAPPLQRSARGSLLAGEQRDTVGGLWLGPRRVLTINARELREFTLDKRGRVLTAGRTLTIPVPARHASSRLQLFRRFGAGVVFGGATLPLQRLNLASGEITTLAGGPTLDHAGVPMQGVLPVVTQRRRVLLLHDDGAVKDLGALEGREGASPCAIRLHSDGTLIVALTTATKGSFAQGQSWLWVLRPGEDEWLKLRVMAECRVWAPWGEGFAVGTNQAGFVTVQPSALREGARNLQPLRVDAAPGAGVAFTEGVRELRRVGKDLLLLTTDLATLKRWSLAGRPKQVFDRPLGVNSAELLDLSPDEGHALIGTCVGKVLLEPLRP